MKTSFKNLLGLMLRLGITLFAFWWVFRSVEMNALHQVFRSAGVPWLLAGAAFFFMAQIGCIIRWGLLAPRALLRKEKQAGLAPRALLRKEKQAGLAPRHPSLRWSFLANSFFVANFFNMFLPTTVGGDVIRGYDLIKATGEWKESLASVLADRLAGFVGFFTFALAAWVAFPPARQDPLVRTAFAGFCGVVVVTFAVLGSRRILQGMLRPFGKIGLGQLQSHAKQFQDALRVYFSRPRQLLAALGVTTLVQICAILMYWAIARALHLNVPLAYLALTVPIILTLAQIPISLNGWGIREGATVLFLGRIGVTTEHALSLSLFCAVIPLLSALIGAVLFLLRRRRKPAKTAGA